MCACRARGQVVPVTSLWVYAYQIAPPQPSHRLGTIRTLLNEASAAARDSTRTWSGRLVLERRATHILIVSNDAGRDHPINRQLEAELDRLEAPFSVTKPLAVTSHAERATAPAAYDGNGR